MSGALALHLLYAFVCDQVQLYLFYLGIPTDIKKRSAQLCLFIYLLLRL
jgi:hypothetical protein